MRCRDILKLLQNRENSLPLKSELLSDLNFMGTPKIEKYLSNVGLVLWKLVDDTTSIRGNLENSSIIRKMYSIEK